MALSYTGKLFQRIVVTSGYTYGKNLRVSYTHMTTKYSEDYEHSRLDFVYRRNAEGRWRYWAILDEYDSEYQFWKALRWLEDNGYITIRWNETVWISRNTAGSDNFIKLTAKGLELAPKYLRQ